MSFRITCDIDPYFMQYGLYSGFMGCFVYLLCGKTRVANLGPTAIMSIITLSYSKGKPPEYAVLLCFLTGVVTFFAGVCQLGTCMVNIFEAQ